MSDAKKNGPIGPQKSNAETRVDFVRENVVPIVGYDTRSKHNTICDQNSNAMGAGGRPVSKMVDAKRLAEILGTTVDAIRYHIKMGRIEPTARLGRKMLFDPEDVIERLKEQSQPKPFGKPPFRDVSKSKSIFENKLVERALGISGKEKR